MAEFDKETFLNLSEKEQEAAVQEELRKIGEIYAKSFEYWYEPNSPEMKKIQEAFTPAQNAGSRKNLKNRKNGICTRKGHRFRRRSTRRKSSRRRRI
jgi:hypothetical protein